VSRSIYKGVLKFLHAQDSSYYCVHPLPVCNFQIIETGDGELTLSWSPQVDTLEQTAVAERYLLQCKVNDGGWDNGIVVDSTTHRIIVKCGDHYSFRVSALNKGGRSLPSETLNACLLRHAKGCVLIANGFNRISGPQGFQIDSTYAGFYGDACGVAYDMNIGYVGDQYEFRKSVSWNDDDAPGFGASYANYEHIISLGNQMNYTGVHGRAFAEEGYSYVSCNASVLDSLYPAHYACVDLILGAQGTHELGLRKVTRLDQCYTHSLLDYMERVAQAGGNLVVSGENIGSDLSIVDDKLLKKRVESLLHYTHMSDNASNTGKLEAIANSLHCFGKQGEIYHFHTDPNQDVYLSKHPDGIVPKGNGACAVMRYKENQLNAAVAYKADKYRSCIFGFPIECLTSQTQINAIIRQIIQFFEKNNNIDN
jgi:hypothetical protein